MTSLFETHNPMPNRTRTAKGGTSHPSTCVASRRARWVNGVQRLEQRHIVCTHDEDGKGAMVPFEDCKVDGDTREPRRRTAPHQLPD